MRRPLYLKFKPSSRLFIMQKIIGGIFLLALICSCKNEREVPNILFIFADDQCYNTIRELGNSEVYTPTLDELARRGTLFTTTYNMGGWHGAVCVASRTMLNTGKFLWRANGLETRLDTLAASGQLWSKEMERLGYETYMTGKWHVNIDPSAIFHHVGTVRGGMPGDVPEMYDRPLDAEDWEWTPWDTAFGGFWEGGTHWSEVVANETMNFLDLASASDHPFFMYVAFNAPHDPRQSPKEFVDMYPLEQLSLPENFLPEYPFKDAIGCGESLRDERLAPFPRSEYAVKVHRQEYYAIISHLDAQIRRIMDHLEKTGQAENTYIFFTADHGLSVGQHGLMGKQNMYDHSMRPPLLVAGPGIPEGKKVETEVYLQDIMPTAIDYAGGVIPEWVEFKSLRPRIEGKVNSAAYPEIYGAYMDLQRMIRVDNYKLIVYPRAGVIRLFDLVHDPSEMEDLAGATDQQERVRLLFGRLKGLQSEMGDTLDLSNYEFNL
jgi:arylsulfatase A-like enzyme